MDNTHSLQGSKGFSDSTLLLVFRVGWRAPLPQKYAASMPLCFAPWISLSDSCAREKPAEKWRWGADAKGVTAHLK
jgi:hypothetical protein